MPGQPARPDPALWDEPTMHRALAARDVGEVYRLLGRGGVSQQKISELTGQSQSEVSEICRGHRQVLAYDLLIRIADGLGIPHGHMGLAYTDAAGNAVTYPGDDSEGSTDPLEDDEMVSRRILGMAAVALLGKAALEGPIMQLGPNLLGEPGGLQLLRGSTDSLGTISKHDVPWIEAMTTRLWDLDHQHGGGSVFAAARETAEQVVGALRVSAPNRDMLMAASGLCRVAAWSAFDAGRRRDF